MSKKKVSITALSSLVLPFIFAIIVTIWMLSARSGLGAGFGVIVFSFYGVGAASIILGVAGIIVVKKNNEKYSGLTAGVIGTILGVGLITFILYFMTILGRGISHMR